MSKWIDDIMDVVTDELGQKLTAETLNKLKKRLGDLVLVVRFE